MNLRRKYATCAAAAGLALGASIAVAAAASAVTPAVSETTHITNDPDSGGNGNWSTDNLVRTLTITADTGACTGLPAGSTCYSASIADDGTFTTIDQAYQPNQGSPASFARIQHEVSGTFSGTASFLFWADKTPADANVPATVNGVPGTSTWYERAFPSGTTFGGPGIGSDWTWTYTTYTRTSPRQHLAACETWTDSAANGDGQSAVLTADGNITGKICPGTSRHPARTGDVVASNGKCLDVAGVFGKAENAPLQIWTCGAAGGADQQFTYDAGKHTLVYDDTAKADDFCVTEVSFKGRAAIEACGTAGADQAVTFSGGRYRFADGTVLDVKGFGKASGTPVLTWPFNGGVNQDWSLPQ